MSSQLNQLIPNISGSEINSKDLDKLLTEIRIVGNKLMKIRAGDDESMRKIAENSLWTLHWALQMLLKYSNQNNIPLVRTHIKSIQDFANRCIAHDKEKELRYLITLLEMQEVK